VTRSVASRTRAMREHRGIPQTALASQLGISRQSLHAIEAGRAIPGVDVAVRIAHALGTTVENLFPMALPATTVDFDGPAGARASGRMALALLSGRWVAYPLGYDAGHVSADAVGTTDPDGLRLEHVRDPRESAHNVILMGCATGLGVLADRLNATTGTGRFIWMGRSSTSSLQSLAAERTHAAGVHLLDEATGIANLPDIRQSRCASPVTVIALGAWEAGFVTAPGNPRGIRSGTDLIHPGMRIAIREVGSGARRLLDRELRPSGTLSSLNIDGPAASSHRDVAHAIAMGAADTGVATRDAAEASGLGFVPIATERYDIVLPTTSLADPRIARLLDTLTGLACRRDLQALGYDTTETGRHVADIAA